MDQQAFRDIMAAFPAGVAVVTARGADGAPKGLTVSAFCPVSLDPPLVLVCIDKTSNTLEAIQSAGGFTVNFLASGREELARRFASKSEEKFDGIAWTEGDAPDAGPILTDDAVAHVACRIHSAIEAGDHWIFVGAVGSGERDPDGTPLVYAQRTFAAWSDLSG